MRKLTFFLAAAVVATTVATPIGAGTAGAEGGTRVPLLPTQRGCDYGFLVHPYWGTSQPAGYGEALIQKNGSTVTADIQFTNGHDLGMHYDVMLIQAPRPSNEPCGPGAPGTAHADMVIDGAGHGAATLQETIRSGSTSVWIKITRPNPHSQDPAESYASAFLAKI